MSTLKKHLKKRVKLNYIIYENNDTFLLLNCIIKSKSKSYHSNIPIELFQFTQLILKQEDSQNVIEKISESLFNTNYPINQVNPAQVLNRDLFVHLDDLFSFSNKIRVSA